MVRDPHSPGRRATHSDPLDRLQRPVPPYGLRLLTALLALAAAGLLGACGSTERLAGEDGSAPPAEEPAPPSSAPTAAEVARIDSLDIWILRDRSLADVRVRGTEEVTVRTGSERETVGAGEPIDLTPSGDRVRVSASPERMTGERVRLSPSRGGALRLQAGSLDRRYPGTLTVERTSSGNGLRLINRVDLETYVASVAATEFPFEQSEGVKAQAIIARTYALRVQDRNEEVAYDLTDDSASQAYRGLDAITELTRRAARTTRGEILAYGDHPIEAVYSASAGGHTADNDVVWGSDPVPYLRGKEDPFDEETPHQRWSFSIRADALHRLLSEEYGFEVREIDFLDRGPSGRYANVRLSGAQSRTVSANTLRLAVVSRFGPRSLKSTFFEVDRQASEYRFVGRGYGHGVGLSQWGARNRAEAGQSYEQILRFYYTDAQLERMPSPGGSGLPALAATGPTAARGEREASSEGGGEQPGPDEETPSGGGSGPGSSPTERTGAPGGGDASGASSDAETASPPRRPGW